MEIKNLTPQEFAENFKNIPEAIILDVRTPEEFESGHLPGALNINIMGHEFHEMIDELDKNRTYFVYCKAGGRSSNACQYMHMQGFQNLNNMVGGILAWEGSIE
jgi:rhodanese-related sulfurtransferase